MGWLGKLCNGLAEDSGESATLGFPPQTRVLEAQMEEGLACQSLAIRERMWFGSRSAKGSTLVRKSTSRLLGHLLG